jgi:aryl-alcohol dehydrogenase-like predicted oxidoreductase
VRPRDFGDTGVKVSEIGFGGWSIGEPQWGNPPLEDSITAIEAALDAGVTFFDTAQEYGYGKSEEVFGDVLGGREGVFVATKTGKYWEGGKFRTDYSPQYIVASAEGSLRRLKTDRIDLYQLHNPGPAVSARPETWEALTKLQQQGKIRFYGSSVESMAEVGAVRKLPLLRAAAEAGLAVIGRTPMAWGALSGKYKPGFTLPEGDFRSPGRWAHKTFSTYVERAQQLRFLEGPKQTLGQAAIRYVLAQKGLSVVIPGAKNAEQVAQNVAAEGELTEEQLARIAELQAQW